MIDGGLFAEKFEFKAWNRHEGGRNPSLITMFLFQFSLLQSITNYFQENNSTERNYDIILLSCLVVCKNMA